MSVISRFLRHVPVPDAAVEIAADHVVGVRVEPRRDGALVVAHAVVALPEGALRPGLMAGNVRDRAAAERVVAEVLERIGRPSRVGLIVPDPVARVTVVRVETLPAREQDLEEFLRWQVRKAVPFSVDEAQVSHVRGQQASEGQEVVVTLARRDVVGEYEGLCTAAGAHAGLVDIATFNVAHAVLASSTSPRGDWLLVHLAPSYASVAVLSGANVRVFRTRAAGADETLDAVVHQTTMYHADRLGGHGFERVVCAGPAAESDQARRELSELRESLERRLGRGVEVLDAGGLVTMADRIGMPTIVARLAPLIGLLVGRREAA